MKRYVVMLKENSFLGKKAVDEDYNSDRACYIGGLNDAYIFNSMKDAKSAWAKNKKEFIKVYKVDPKKISFEEVPSKGLSLEEGERELFGGAASPFDKEYNTWQRYAIKELTASEALHKLADFVPDYENYKSRMQLYFWDTYEDQNGHGWPSGGFTAGGFSPLYGYDHENKRFISENLVGCWQYKDHAGSFRIIDSGFRVPIYIDNELSWCNQRFFVEWVRYDGHKIEELDNIKPAFETSINFEKFIKDVKEELKKYGYGTCTGNNGNR